MGVQLAWPDRPVLALLGEGASMYGIQGLWTAARYNLPVTFVICNNAQYQILKIGASRSACRRPAAGDSSAWTWPSPKSTFVDLAQSLGVKAQRITEPDELETRLKESLAGDEPRLFDVPVERGSPPRLNYG